MTDKQVKLNFHGEPPIPVRENTQHTLYRGEDDHVYIKPEGSKRRKLPMNKMVSGKDSGRGPNDSPYIIEIQDDLTVKIKVFNSTNPVTAGSKTTTHSPQGIKIDQYDSANKVSIGGTGGPADFHFLVELPEDPSEEREDEDSSSGRFDEDSFQSSSTEEKTDDGRVIKTEMLRDVVTALDEVHREHAGQQDFPTVADFYNKLGEEGLLRNPRANVIYIDDGAKYTVKDILEAIQILQEKKQKVVPVKEAHKVSRLAIWRQGLKNRITSEGNLRSDIGELFLWNESNGVLIGEAANQSRRERIETLVK